MSRPPMLMAMTMIMMTIRLLDWSHNERPHKTLCPMPMVMMMGPRQSNPSLALWPPPTLSRRIIKTSRINWATTETSTGWSKELLIPHNLWQLRNQSRRRIRKSRTQCRATMAESAAMESESILLSVLKNMMKTIAPQKLAASKRKKTRTSSRRGKSRGAIPSRRCSPPPPQPHPSSRPRPPIRRRESRSTTTATPPTRTCRRSTDSYRRRSLIRNTLWVN
mmetsp:Transcript_29556/g.62789  ORF Transcript_29556/g.62789 Transcript_29556/m.62789 type:complete len:221 (-) Transcript_29556:1160-1822(-)